MSGTDHVLPWVASALERGARRLELWSWTLLADRRCVSRWDVAGVNDNGAAKVAEQILQSATAHGSQQNGQSLAYRIVALPDQGDQIDETFVNVDGRSAKSPHTPSIGPAHDTATALAHTMQGFNKLAEINAKLLSQKCPTCESYRTMMQQQAREAIDLRAQVTQMALAHRRIIFFEREQASAARREEREDQMFSAALSKFDLLVPAILNRLATGGDKRKGAPLANAMLSAVFGSFTPAQVDQIMEGALFTIEQKLAFGELYQAYEAAHRAKTMLNESPAAPEAPPNPHANGASAKDPPS
jgi:hypothetical protein